MAKTQMRSIFSAAKRASAVIKKIEAVRTAVKKAQQQPAQIPPKQQRYTPVSTHIPPKAALPSDTGYQSILPEPHQANELHNFISSINTDHGHALQDKFEAIISLPTNRSGSTTTASAGAINKFNLSDISLRIESINLPGRNLDTTTDTNIYGPTREIVNGVSYAEDISIVFLASSDLRERKFFEEWQNRAINPATWDIGYYNDYVGIIEIYLMDKNGKRLFGVKLHEAFPKTIGPTPLSNAQKNALIKTEVSFVFRYWTPIDEIKPNPMEHYIGRGSGAIFGAGQLATSRKRNEMNMPATERFLGF
tara:strand:- start:1700 stop:2620 length:921 start_codon:yes stop_codon:yes gene_type:complete